MKKRKKLLKYLKNNSKLYLGIVIGGVIFGSLGVYAASVISSNEVTYSNSGSGLSSTNVKGAIDELNTKATTKIAEAKRECPSGNICTNTWAKVGDYVKMTPSSTSYTITTAMTGWNSNQTINPSELNLWRVISINSDGTIDLVSQYVSSTNVYFTNKTGYLNFITSLNQIASQYTNSKYTVSSRHMGYNGQTGTITDTSALDATTAPWTENTSASSTTLSSEARGGGDMGYMRDYYLVLNAIGTNTACAAGTASAAKYWLATRFYRYNYSDPTDWVFAGTVLGFSGEWSWAILWCHYNGGFCLASPQYAVRPIITLKSGLAPSGSGTSSSPYVLN